jgi:RNA polymerase sigma-70 factor (ECF subfamily)
VLDPADFRDFYDAALPRVCGFFLHRCGGRVSVAEDLTQDTFVAAVGELRKNRAVGAPLPWIYGIARHMLHDHYRAEARARMRSAPAEDADAIADAILTAVRVEDRVLTSQTLAAVAPLQRAALVLCYVDGLSMAEAGDALGKSAEAVESLLARGRRAFKQAYAEASS